jgi:hypothetical protein
MYDDDDTLKAAASQLVAQGIRIKEVFSPFPVHGIDPIIGIKRTRLAITAFMYASTGTALALLGMWYFMIHDWPMNIGGKPALAWVDFVPVTFELTVLITALGMVATYLVSSDFIPGNEPKMPDPRITSDVFCIAIPVEGASATVGSRLRQLGAEVQEKEVEL